jgi:hypothetical protein
MFPAKTIVRPSMNSYEFDSIVSCHLSRSRKHEFYVASIVVYSLHLPAGWLVWLCAVSATFRICSMFKTTSLCMCVCAPSA